MINVFPRYIISFIILVLLQVLILNNIQLSGYINPYIYILFILTLPLDTPKWALLVLGFLLGLSVDLFTHTVGMHTSATVFLAFLRPALLNSMEPRGGYEPDASPSIQDHGLRWFFRYAAISILAHHMFLFFVEVFKFANFFQTLSRAILSGIFSLVLILFIKLFIKK